MSDEPKIIMKVADDVFTGDGRYALLMKQHVEGEAGIDVELRIGGTSNEVIAHFQADRDIASRAMNSYLAVWPDERIHESGPVTRAGDEAMRRMKLHERHG